MKNSIIEIINKFNGGLITDIENEKTIIYDEEYIILRDYMHNYFIIYENIVDDIFNVEEILLKIEEICLYSNHLVNIKPQFINAIIIVRLEEIDDREYKKIIEIEENEYFCKKYLFYYKETEREKFLEWAKKNKKESFNELINIEDNYKLFDKLNDNLEALKFMMRMIIKIPCIKINLQNKGEYNFETELKEQIQLIRDVETKKIVDNFNSSFEELSSNEVEEAVEIYLTKFSEV